MSEHQPRKVGDLTLLPPKLKESFYTAQHTGTMKIAIGPHE